MNDLKLLPRKPTADMWEHGYSEACRQYSAFGNHNDVDKIWCAMFDAAPAELHDLERDAKKGRALLRSVLYHVSDKTQWDAVIAYLNALPEPAAASPPEREPMTAHCDKWKKSGPIHADCAYVCIEAAAPAAASRPAEPDVERDELQIEYRKVEVLWKQEAIRAERAETTCGGLERAAEILLARAESAEALAASRLIERREWEKARQDKMDALELWRTVKAELQRENEALRGDAARYRWLREVDPDAELPTVLRHRQDSWGNWRYDVLILDELDAAIDAALAQQTGGDHADPA
jgi:hypothetical protein